MLPYPLQAAGVIDKSSRVEQFAFIKNGQNPEQIPSENLPAAAATRVVGGMGSHWTCCTPREHPMERSTLFDDNKWKSLYDRAEKLFDTNEKSFEKSIRQQLVKKTLEQAFPDRGMKSMPLACKRNQKNKHYIEWSATATILGDISEPNKPNDLFEIKPNTQCLALAIGPDNQVEMAKVKDILKDEIYYIKAKKYVICAGAVLTPGILCNPPEKGGHALGRSLPALVS